MLENYDHFDGLAWSTGYLHNALAYQGARAPHTGKPYSEALLMGINGGIAAGYFAFEYKGYDPHLHFLTRYPFNEQPGSVFERLDIPMQSRQTTDPEKGAANVINALVAGTPAVVWADVTTLYGKSTLPGVGPDAWLIMPVLVFGYEKNMVHIADRARVALTTDVAAFAASRTRIAKTRHRVMTIGQPKPDRLPGAIEAGVRDCIGIFTGTPPVGAKSSWGFEAYRKWMDLLVGSRNASSWAKQFAPGRRMYAGLVSAYQYVEVWFTGGCGARHIYAEFLDEAAQILGKTGLREVAQRFRTCATHWQTFTRALLPDAVESFKETRDLLNRDYDLFLTQGNASRPEREQIAQRLAAIKEEVTARFPLTEHEAGLMRAELREHIQHILDAEQEAFARLAEAHRE
jgi:hypothetical protein